jgi:hypothetical protein
MTEKKTWSQPSPKELLVLAQKECPERRRETFKRTKEQRNITDPHISRGNKPSQIPNNAT